MSVAGDDDHHFIMEGYIFLFFSPQFFLGFPALLPAPLLLCFLSVLSLCFSFSFALFFLFVS